ncbi:erythromycin esterase family protein [Priestia megaterium]|uniref:erythromycin esterase family protein n=1 Tax=Priestia megaterium TaxID=1404 RepID=UPI003879FAC7
MLKTIQMIEAIKKHSMPFADVDDLLPLINTASRAQYVLLGEASHGTSEFYEIRAAITKELIQHHDFSFIAVEGDWPSCFEVNRYIKGYTTQYANAEDVLRSFSRWPSWMWANQEINDLIERLRDYNNNLPAHQPKVGFYGLDVYSLWESMEAIIEYLENNHAPDAKKAKKAFECFEPFHREAQMYGISSALYGKNCMVEILELLQTIQQKKDTYTHEPEAALSMQVNALVASNAEAYYHTMITNDNESWNIRDRHMVEALKYIQAYYKDSAKGIVWEHNTHIGDARATDMKSSGMVNVGQLTREEYGQKHVYAVGFGTHHGTVIASDSWGNRHQELTVPPAIEGSWEDAIHRAGAFDQYLMFTEENRTFFHSTIGHRAIGVVYDPEIEQYGNYVPSRLSKRYDAFIYVEKTHALSPLIF